MSSTVFTPLAQGFTWNDPTTNTDGTALSAGEVTGYEIGVRADGTTQPAPPADYAQNLTATGASATAVSVAVVQGALNLKPGDYWAAIRTVGPTDSAYSAEIPFAIPAPPPVPNPPSGFTAA